MILAGVTGGIGSGKSTFAALLAERGAHVLDADELGRDALSPGRPAWHAVIDQFGDEILVEGSSDIDRKRLARIVFSDKKKLAALNAIVHPIIMNAIADELEVVRGTDSIVVLDAALIVDLGLDKTLDVLIVVNAGEKARASRLVDRGMNVEDALARMEAQVSPETLMERADIVVSNEGNLDALAREADRVYERLKAMEA